MRPSSAGLRPSNGPADAVASRMLRVLSGATPVLFELMMDMFRRAWLVSGTWAGALLSSSIDGRSHGHYSAVVALTEKRGHCLVVAHHLRMGGGDSRGLEPGL